MSTESLSEVYGAVCSKYKTHINPYVSEVLQQNSVKKSVVLKLSGNIQKLDDNDVFVLTQSLRNNNSVTELDVSYNNITDEGAKHLADLLQDQSSALKSLDLRFNNITAGGAEVLAKGLQRNAALLTLRLSGNKFGDGGGVHVARMLQVNDTLQDVELNDCDLSIRSVTALAVVLKSNTSLRRVDISRALLFSHQEEWAGQLGEMLLVNSSLLELHLGKMGMTDTGMERLTEGLRFNRSLRYLDLRCNRVTRDGVRLLAEVLKQNPTLESLDLSSNRMEDDGAVCLSEAIAGPACGLRELSVTRNGITTAGLLSLVQATKASTTLAHLYVWGNKLEESVCRAFRELTASGRLLPQHTDVSAYEVDGRVFLAQVSHMLRRHYYATVQNDAPPPTPLC